MSGIYKALERAEKERKKKLVEDPDLRIFEEDFETPRKKAGKETLELELEPIGLPGKMESSIPIVPAHSFAAEQFRKVKTSIFRRSPNPPRLIMVTSSASGEGKTTVALNLALSISQELNKKVILVDADLRKASIDLRQYKKGLSDFLSDQISINEILKDFQASNLMVIPPGAPSPRAAELISSHRMKNLLKDLKELGEDTFIIIDSPPVLATSEPLILSEWVDGVILVVMADQVPKGHVRKVVNSIGKEKILGVVFNQMNLNNSSAYYYARYGSDGRGKKKQ